MTDKVRVINFDKLVITHLRLFPSLIAYKAVVYDISYVYISVT